eukprot:gene4500-87_t
MAQNITRLLSLFISMIAVILDLTYILNAISCGIQYIMRQFVGCGCVTLGICNIFEYINVAIVLLCTGTQAYFIPPPDHFQNHIPSHDRNETKQERTLVSCGSSYLKQPAMEERLLANTEQRQAQANMTPTFYCKEISSIIMRIVLSFQRHMMKMIAVKSCCYYDFVEAWSSAGFTGRYPYSIRSDVIAFEAVIKALPLVVCQCISLSVQQIVDNDTIPADPSSNFHRKEEAKSNNLSSTIYYLPYFSLIFSLYSITAALVAFEASSSVVTAIRQHLNTSTHQFLLYSLRYAELAGVTALVTMSVLEPHLGIIAFLFHVGSMTPFVLKLVQQETTSLTENGSIPREINRLSQNHRVTSPSPSRWWSILPLLIYWNNGNQMKSSHSPSPAKYYVIRLTSCYATLSLVYAFNSQNIFSSPLLPIYITSTIVLTVIWIPVALNHWLYIIPTFQPAYDVTGVSPLKTPSTRTVYTYSTVIDSLEKKLEARNRSKGRTTRASSLMRVNNQTYNSGATTKSPGRRSLQNMCITSNNLNDKLNEGDPPTEFRAHAEEIIDQVNVTRFFSSAAAARFQQKKQQDYSKQNLEKLSATQPKDQSLPIGHETDSQCESPILKTISRLKKDAFPRSPLRGTWRDDFYTSSPLSQSDHNQ